MTRVAVVGVGAIGGAVAAALAEAGRHQLVLCVRQRFARLELRRGDAVTARDVQVETDPSSVEVADFVLVATKAYDTQGARSWLDRLCGAATIVAVLQNGVDHVERVQPLVGSAVVVPVVVFLAAERLTPGVIAQGSAGHLTVPATDAGRAFAALFEGSPMGVEASGAVTASSRP